MKVDRWEIIEITGGTAAQVALDGEYVKYTDYEALEQHYKADRKKRNRAYGREIEQRDKQLWKLEAVRMRRWNICKQPKT
jgi:hypothetical protein